MTKIKLGNSGVTYGVCEIDNKDHFYVINGDYSNKGTTEIDDEDIILLLTFESKEHIDNVIKSLNMIKKNMKWIWNEDRR